MKWKRINPSRWRNGLIGAALAAVAGLGFLISPLGWGLAGLSYDSLFYFRSDIPVHDVVILYMDPESDTRLGQKRRGSWDRALHARLLDRLRAYQPRVVAFDALFLASPDETEGDAELVRAAKASGNVVVAAKPTADLHEGEFVSMQMGTPFPQLRDVVKWGVAEAGDVDSGIRQHHYVRELDVPSMAWRVAELAMTNPPAPYVPRWINYYGPAGFLDHFSYYQMFATNEADAIPPGALSNKFVFVGGLYDVAYAGGKRSDDYPTPHTRWAGRRSAGVEICATAFLNLYRGDWLRRLPPWAEVCVIILAAVACGFLLASRRPMATVGLALLGFLLVGAVGVLTTWQTLTWFPWLIIGAVQIPVAAGWSVLAHTRQLYHEKHAAEQALAIARQGEVQVFAPAGAQPAPLYPRLGTPSALVTPTPGASPWSSAPGDQTVPIVADHELLRCIGKGAYGEVWLARDVIGTYHAVKIVRQHSLHDPAPLEREFNGIKNFTPLSRSHPGFVHILQVGRNEAAGYIYCVMELGDDEATGQRINPDTYSAKNLAREFKHRGRLPLAECLRLGIQLAEALEHLHHHNLIHRDIKPSNIIFVSGVPKFADIGLVTAVAGEGREATVVGTPGRMAPEGPGKPSADVYSLGKVLYEAGFGLDISRFPELPTDVIQTADESAMFDFNRIIMKACESDENRRYKTADALRADLAKLLKRMDPSG